MINYLRSLAYALPSRALVGRLRTAGTAVVLLVMLGRQVVCLDHRLFLHSHNEPI
jgi:hypothetical protein